MGISRLSKLTFDRASAIVAASVDSPETDSKTAAVFGSKDATPS